MVLLNQPYLNTTKTIDLTIWTFVGEVLSAFWHITRFHRFSAKKYYFFLIRWPKTQSGVILEHKKIKTVTAFHFSPSICHGVMLGAGGERDDRRWYTWMASIWTCSLEGKLWQTKKDIIFKSRDITLPTEACITKAMVFPVVVSGCESWAIKKLSTKELMLLNCAGEGS